MQAFWLCLVGLVSISEEQARDITNDRCTLMQALPFFDMAARMEFPQSHGGPSPAVLNSPALVDTSALWEGRHGSAWHRLVERVLQAKNKPEVVSRVMEQASMHLHHHITHATGTEESMYQLLELCV